MKIRWRDGYVIERETETSCQRGWGMLCDGLNFNMISASNDNTKKFLS